jgi:hypothetical protein
MQILKFTEVKEQNLRTFNINMKLINFILIVFSAFSCLNKNVINSKDITSNNVKKDTIYTSKKNDYCINFGNKWKLTYQDSPDSSNIIISTHIIDLDELEMLRLFRFDNDTSSLESKLQRKINEVKKYFPNAKISDVYEIKYLENSALAFEYEFYNGNEEDKNDNFNNIEIAIVMESKNENYYLFELATKKNENYRFHQKALLELLKTFRSK